jgi:hypothetical protein
MHPLRATPRYTRAIEAVADLLAKLRIESMFVGSVARSAWLGGLIESGSIDVLGVMQPQQKNQVAMMASNRGFRVDRDELDQTEELDLIPLTWIDEDDVRVHVLVASNALYARMFGAATWVGLSSPTGTCETADATAESSRASIYDSASTGRTRESDLRLPEIRVPSAEDTALLLSMSEEHDDVRILAASDQFDRRAFNDKLVSIGLRELVL